VFDQQTARAVFDFQSRERLEPDRIVGPLTWDAIARVLERAQ
jgi:peptidoglycan hydrolase-like protein with peptidoglycan-binding domain